MAATFNFSSVAARHKIFKQYTNIVRKADSVSVYTIDSIPTDPSLQNASKKYIADYLITASDPFDTAKTSTLQKAVLEKNNYLHDAMKRCPFMAKYAIEFVKGKKKIVVIISPANCSKVMVYLPNRTQALAYDLSEKNNIETALPVAINKL